MFKKILIGLVIIIVAFAGLVAVQPDEFEISRTNVVAAAPSDVFAYVNDFHRWELWSPWAKLDPAMKAMFEGPAQGEGSVYGWSGDDKVGEGKMTILKSQAPEAILIKLDFLRPMVATNMTEFTFKPEGSGTSVRWAMSGKLNFIAKACHLFINMDKMLGGDFEKGLAQLKEAAETKK